MNPSVVVDVTEETISDVECYTHLRVDYDSDGPYDASLIKMMLAAAREDCENFAGLSFATKTLEYHADKFEDEIYLPFGPVNSIVSVSYENGEIDSDDLPVRFDAGYRFNPYTSKLRSNSTWPSGSNIVVNYVAGYGVGSDSKPLPSAAKIAILLTLGHFYENRQDVVEFTRTLLAPMPHGAESILRPLRERLGMA